jgi:ribulose-phosphate 3-epimerase
MLAKVKELSRDHPHLPWVAVDGGVSVATAAACAAAGANMLVAGTAIFSAGQSASSSSAVFARLADAVSQLQKLGADAQIVQTLQAEASMKGP